VFLLHSGVHGRDVGGHLAMDTTSPRGMTVAVALSSFAVASVALLAARLSKTPFSARLRLGPGSLSTWQTAAVILGACGLGLGLGSLREMAHLDSKTILAVQQSLRAAEVTTLIPLAIAIAIGAPFAEETFFRGYVQTRLRARWGTPVGVTVVAILFGVFHMDPVQGLYAFGIGLYLGWAADMAGSIRPAIGGHLANNTLSLLPAFVGESALRKPTTGEGIVYAVVGFAVMAGAIVFVTRGASSGST
jgi:uncharacterized protein